MPLGAGVAQSFLADAAALRKLQQDSGARITISAAAGGHVALLEGNRAEVDKGRKLLERRIEALRWGRCVRVCEC